MKKNKIYILIALLTSVIVFSIAALCNQCGVITPATTTATTAASESASVSATAAVQETTSITTVAAAITTATTTAATTAGTTAETAAKVAPTVKLEIYEGPTYSADDDICYYRIKATVTGNPAPKVTFSKDDSNGAWGSKKVQINIHRFQPYTLTATATNSVSSASDSITLSWGCGSENRNPEISEINIPGGTLYTGQQYDISASASDPDGDSLTYAWNVSGGSINNTVTNPMKWTTPNVSCDCIIKVKVTDGKGGEAIESKTVSVSSPAISSMEVPHVTTEGGYIASGGVPINAGGCLFVGDCNTNKWVVGYISYDITGLADATIENASMTFHVKKKWGDPSFYSHFCIFDPYWGAMPISVGTLSINGPVIQNISPTTSGNFTVDVALLKSELQAAINAGHPRFQIGISPQGTPTNNNNTWDGIEWDQSGITLKINYTH